MCIKSETIISPSRRFFIENTYNVSNGLSWPSTQEIREGKQMIATIMGGTFSLLHIFFTFADQEWVLCGYNGNPTLINLETHDVYEGPQDEFVWTSTRLLENQTQPSFLVKGAKWGYQSEMKVYELADFRLVNCYLSKL